MAYETGWLIEREIPSALKPMYFSLDENQPGWTPDNYKALRFSRFEDAKAFCNVFLAGTGCPAEHGWGP